MTDPQVALVMLLLLLFSWWVSSCGVELWCKVVVVGVELSWLVESISVILLLLLLLWVMLMLLLL